MIVTIRVRPSQQGGKEEYVRLAEMATMNEVLAELAATARHYAEVRNHHHRATAWSSCGKVLATVGVGPVHSSDFDHLFRWRSRSGWGMRGRTYRGSSTGWGAPATGLAPIGADYYGETGSGATTAASGVASRAPHTIQIGKRPT